MTSQCTMQLPYAVVAIERHRRSGAAPPPRRRTARSARMYPRSTSATPSSDPRWSRCGYLIASSTVASLSSDGVRCRANRKGLRGYGSPSKVTVTSLIGRQLRVSGSSHTSNVTVTSLVGRRSRVSPNSLWDANRCVRRVRGCPHQASVDLVIDEHPIYMCFLDPQTISHPFDCNLVDLYLFPSHKHTRHKPIQGRPEVLAHSPSRMT